MVVNSRWGSVALLFLVMGAILRTVHIQESKTKQKNHLFPLHHLLLYLHLHLLYLLILLHLCYHHLLLLAQELSDDDQ